MLGFTEYYNTFRHKTGQSAGDVMRIASNSSNAIVRFSGHWNRKMETSGSSICILLTHFTGYVGPVTGQSSSVVPGGGGMVIRIYD